MIRLLYFIYAINKQIFDNTCAIDMTRDKKITILLQK